MADEHGGLRNRPARRQQPRGDGRAGAELTRSTAHRRGGPARGLAICTRRRRLRSHRADRGSAEGSLIYLLPEAQDRLLDNVNAGAGAALLATEYHLIPKGHGRAIGPDDPAGGARPD